MLEPRVLASQDDFERSCADDAGGGWLCALLLLAGPADSQRALPLHDGRFSVVVRRIPASPHGR